MSCAGCNAVLGPAQILASGVKVCETCPAWRAEQEAKTLMTRTLAERRAHLASLPAGPRAWLEEALIALWRRS